MGRVILPTPVKRGTFGRLLCCVTQSVPPRQAVSIFQSSMSPTVVKSTYLARHPGRLLLTSSLWLVSPQVDFQGKLDFREGPGMRNIYPSYCQRAHLPGFASFTVSRDEATGLLSTVVTVLSSTGGAL